MLCSLSSSVKQKQKSNIQYFRENGEMKRYCDDLSIKKTSVDMTKLFFILFQSLFANKIFLN